MANQKHMTLTDRAVIDRCLGKGMSFKAIAAELDKDCTTISKEVRLHRTEVKKGCHGHAYNPCVKRFSCDCRLLCNPCGSTRKNAFCRFCSNCHRACPEYAEEKCELLLKPPYVCNGCIKYGRCSLTKLEYHAPAAHQVYRDVFSESHAGINLTEDELEAIDKTVSPLMKKGQSIHHIVATNQSEVTVSESTLYRMMDGGLLTARPLDMPRKVRLKPRKKAAELKVDKGCRIGRTYQDYEKFMTQNQDVPAVQMDSVEGKKGGSVLLTIHFVKTELMLAYIRPANTAKSVTDIFSRLYSLLGHEDFVKLFPVILTDNGSEFSDPASLEFCGGGIRRTNVFYCNPGASYQKGSIERNHEFIREILPKGTSMDGLSQEDIDLMAGHINSYSRKSIYGKSPNEMFEHAYGSKIFQKLGCRKIPPQEILLRPQLLK